LAEGFLALLHDSRCMLVSVLLNTRWFGGLALGSSFKFLLCLLVLVTCVQ
jgi:hypothetical protein